MRKLAFVLILLLTCSAVQSFACGVDKDALQPTWRYPEDKKWIKGTSHIGPFQAQTLPHEVQYQAVAYKKPGLLTKAPDGRGWWEVRQVYKLSYKGKTFAIVGIAYFPLIENGKRTGYAGCVTNVAVYDEDGSGIFNSVADSGFNSIHIPAWADKQEKK